MATREENLFFAKLSEQAERYEDMMKYTKRYVDQSQASSVELSLEERNLLSVSYKNGVAGKRQAVRAIDDCLQDPRYQVQEVLVYKQRVEQELTENCNEILSTLDSFLIPTAKTFDNRAFYMKMKGDYYRYLAEFSADRASSAQAARDAYCQAKVVADNLPATSSIRLGLVLNFSVFYYEVAQEKDEAIRLASQALQDAMAMRSTSPATEDFADSDAILRLLHDNLQLWQSSGSQGATQDGTEVEDL